MSNPWREAVEDDEVVERELPHPHGYCACACCELTRERINDYRAAVRTRAEAAFSPDGGRLAEVDRLETAAVRTGNAGRELTLRREQVRILKSLVSDLMAAAEGTRGHEAEHDPLEVPSSQRMHIAEATALQYQRERARDLARAQATDALKEEG